MRGKAMGQRSRIAAHLLRVTVVLHEKVDGRVAEVADAVEEDNPARVIPENSGLGACIGPSAGPEPLLESLLEL